MYREQRAQRNDTYRYEWGYEGGRGSGEEEYEEGSGEEEYEEDYDGDEGQYEDENEQDQRDPVEASDEDVIAGEQGNI
jgi:hypothetical protein